MRLLPAAARTWSAWRNGGGRTSEVAIAPPGAPLDGFDWRISIAQIERNGPFSAFPGVTRSLVLLSGGPLLLRGTDATRRLEPGEAWHAFDGDMAIDAEVAAPATVLNVMTRSGWQHLIGAGPAPADAERLLVARTPLRIGEIALAAFDALWLAPEDGKMPAGADVEIRIWRAA